ncbi:MAG: adenylosuccinate synthase [Thaumarchaeota archaeon]|jgi:adenylosuccinate synthase|nr:adenylosuccinate synthase [Candidatus Wolframiiraptor allenii]
MPGIVIVGLQWGDEGKGKISYLLCRDADCVVRFQGGANAGHTVVVEGRRLKFNILPAGSAAGARPCIASGTVVDLDEVFEELEMLKSMGLEARLMISRSASVVLPIHKKLDSRIEEARGGSAVGTTRRGIGPTYSDKALRTGLRIEDLLNPDDLRERLEILKRFHGEEPGDFENLRRMGERIAPYVGDVELYVNDVLDEGGKVVFEGAQGTLLDIDHGTYPYVTSSNTIAGAACTGCGIGPTRISEVIGVAKAYTTRVGAGVFPTEVGGELGERLREVGQEYGTTTGRPRRVGWLDIPLLRYAIRISNVDWIALTKLDVLSGLDKIKICVEYEYDGKILKIAPPAVRLLSRVKPIYEEVKGWEKISEDEWRSIAERGWEALPDEAKAYVELLEDLLGKPIKLISIGADAGMEVER